MIPGPELGADTGFGTERLHPGVASASVLICFSIRVKLICFSICMCWSASAQTSLLVLDSQYLSKSTQKIQKLSTSQHPCINQRWQGGATNALWWTVFSRMQRWGCVYFSGIWHRWVCKGELCSQLCLLHKQKRYFSGHHVGIVSTWPTRYFLSHHFGFFNG